MPTGKYFRVDPHIHRQAKIASAKAGMDIGDWVGDAVKEKLSRPNVKNSPVQIDDSGIHYPCASSAQDSPYFQMLDLILSSDDPDAPDAIRQNIRTFYRLCGGDPDGIIDASSGPPETPSGPIEGSEGPRKPKGKHPGHDRALRKKAG